MTSKRYRVYIGEAPTRDVVALALRYFTGATVTTGTGIWGGETERTTVVEVLCSEEGAFARVTCMEVHLFAQTARITFNQDCVLVTTDVVETELVTA